MPASLTHVAAPTSPSKFCDWIPSRFTEHEQAPPPPADTLLTNIDKLARVTLELGRHAQGAIASQTAGLRLGRAPVVSLEVPIDDLGVALGERHRHGPAVEREAWRARRLGEERRQMDTTD